MEHQIKQILLLNMPERDATALLPALVGPVIVCMSPLVKPRKLKDAWESQAIKYVIANASNKINYDRSA